MKELLPVLSRVNSALADKFQNDLERISSLLERVKTQKQKIISAILAEKNSGGYITTIAYEYNTNPLQPEERLSPGGLISSRPLIEEDIVHYCERANFIEKTAHQALIFSEDTLTYNEEMGFFIIFPETLQPADVWERIPLGQTIHLKFLLENDKDKLEFEIDNAIFCLREGLEELQKRESEETTTYTRESLERLIATLEFYNTI